MICRPKPVHRKILLAVVFAAPACVSGADEIRIESAITFNTSCARCHEGECSDRLSFDLPEHAADRHIRRYAGEASPQTIGELFDLLRHMKEQCSFYPLPSATDRQWDGEMLDRLKSPAGKAYFVPLGVLEPGLYRLSLEGVGADAEPCMELISEEFEFIDYQRVAAGDGLAVLFRIEVRAEYFLRITSTQPIGLRRLELLPHEAMQR